ncbi:hypothetical protein GcM3_008050 [Golovinomyces cichoracearum]|uniref:Integrase and RNaseH domain-containing protein n=1 Tax=Golovinomyces cichoracearum TaxID=62708 RepID=A0A420JAD6_9PEZI|nr:hypothetical protein GcM3_008050 [Golovinomyces cichoracearum]
MKRNSVNEEITGSLDITVVENLTEANLNGMAYWFMQLYDEKGVFGPNLQWAFQDLQGEWDNKEEDHQQQTKDYSTLASQFSRELGNLAKFYNDDIKYDGAEDSLDICLDHFEDTCLNAGLPPIAYSLGTPTMLKGNARKYYYHRISKLKLGHEGSIKRIREHFETEARRQDYLAQYPEKSLMECFEMLLDKLHKLQGVLSDKIRDDESVRDRLQVACQMIPACSKACFAPNPTFERLTAEIRNAISTEGRLVRVNASYKGYLAYANFTDQNFRGPTTRNETFANMIEIEGNDTETKVSQIVEKIIVKRSVYQRREVFDRIKARMHSISKPHKDHHIRQFIIGYEGEPEEKMDDRDIDIDQLIMEFDFSCNSSDGETAPAKSSYTSNCFDNSSDVSFNFLSNYGEELDGNTTIKFMQDQAFLLSISKLPTTEVYTNGHRYGSSYLQGIILDSGAAQFSSTGYQQLVALQKIREVKLKTKTAGRVQVCFGDAETVSSIGTAAVQTNIGTVLFVLFQ